MQFAADAQIGQKSTMNISKGTEQQMLKKVIKMKLLEIN